MIVLEHHEPTYEYALANPDYWLHELAKQVKAKGGIKAAGGRNGFPGRKHSMLVSRDGIAWEYRPDYDWGYPLSSPSTRASMSAVLCTVMPGKFSGEEDAACPTAE